MAKVISFINLKGGVGKTTLAVNFAAYCGMINKRTLLIDLDPQTNATFWCLSVEDWHSHAKQYGTVANLLGAKQNTHAGEQQSSASDLIKREVFENVDLLPSHLDLFTIDLDIAGMPARERKLKRALKDVQDHYDVIVCDCPPNLTIPTQNALAITDNYIIPICQDYLSALGVGLLINRVDLLSEELETSPKLSGIVISRVGRTATIREETEADIRRRFKEDVLPHRLAERSAVIECTASHESIFSRKNTDAENEFRQVCRDLAKRTGISK